VIVLARGGGSFEDLLPFSDERVVRAVAACTVPVVSAVGHEQDTPLCDLAADVRASTPTHAARLVVPDAARLRESLDRSRERLHRGAQRIGERHAMKLATAHDRLQRAPLLALERKTARLAAAHGRLRALSPSATLERGYAIVRRGDDVVRAPAQVRSGEAVAIRVAEGSFGAVVE
jgi:exodeoxyribonuclease VII large subunit